MSSLTAVEAIPSEPRMPMLKVLDAFQCGSREQLAGRREDFAQLVSAVHELSVAQKEQELEQEFEARLHEHEEDDVNQPDPVVRGRAAHHPSTRRSCWP